MGNLIASSQECTPNRSPKGLLADRILKEFEEGEYAKYLDLKSSRTEDILFNARVKEVDLIQKKIDILSAQIDLNKSSKGHNRQAIREFYMDVYDSYNKEIQILGEKMRQQIKGLCRERYEKEEKRHQEVKELFRSVARASEERESLNSAYGMGDFNAEAARDASAEKTVRTDYIKKENTAQKKGLMRSFCRRIKKTAAMIALAALISIPKTAGLQSSEDEKGRDPSNPIYPGISYSIENTSLYDKAAMNMGSVEMKENHIVVEFPRRSTLSYFVFDGKKCVKDLEIPIAYGERKTPTPITEGVDGPVKIITGIDPLNPPLVNAYDVKVHAIGAGGFSFQYLEGENRGKARNYDSQGNKINYRNMRAVYLRTEYTLKNGRRYRETRYLAHASASKAMYNSLNRRAVSLGCVRLAPADSRKISDRVNIPSGETMPVIIKYNRFECKNEKLIIYRDVYGYDSGENGLEKAMREIIKNDPLAVHVCPEKLRKAVENKGSAVVPLKNLYKEGTFSSTITTGVNSSFYSYAPAKESASADKTI